MTKYIFFDIGDVIFNEDLQHIWMFHTLLATLRRHGAEVTWDEFDAHRISLAMTGPDPEAAIKESLRAFSPLPGEVDEYWHEARDLYEQMRKPRPYGLLLDGIEPVLRSLRNDYNLGIIANQHPEVMEGLRDYGIAPLFDVIVISEIVGLFKPDPAIFNYALEKTGISAEEAVFVGDRPDNDVRPAKALGFRTVRFRRGVQYTYYTPSDAAQTADATVSDVRELGRVIRSVAQ